MDTFTERKRFAEDANQWRYFEARRSDAPSLWDICVDDPEMDPATHLLLYVVIPREVTHATERESDFPDWDQGDSIQLNGKTYFIDGCVLQKRRACALLALKR